MVWRFLTTKNHGNLRFVSLELAAIVWQGHPACSDGGCGHNGSAVKQ